MKNDKNEIYDVYKQLKLKNRQKSQNSEDIEKILNKQKLDNSPNNQIDQSLKKEKSKPKIPKTNEINIQYSNVKDKLHTSQLIPNVNERDRDNFRDNRNRESSKDKERTDKYNRDPSKDKDKNEKYNRFPSKEKINVRTDTRSNTISAINPNIINNTLTPPSSQGNINVGNNYTFNYNNIKCVDFVL